MKKIILLVFVLTALLSCSSDDTQKSDKIEVNNETLAGVWYISKFIKTDGTIINYESKCSTKRDYFQFFNYLKVYSYITKSDCEYGTIYQEGCSELLLDSNQDATEIISCSGMLRGKVKLTKTTLQIDYEIPYDFDSAYMGMKSVILSRN